MGGIVTGIGLDDAVTDLGGTIDETLGGIVGAVDETGATVGSPPTGGPGAVPALPGDPATPGLPALPGLTAEAEASAAAAADGSLAAQTDAAATLFSTTAGSIGAWAAASVSHATAVVTVVVSSAALAVSGPLNSAGGLSLPTSFRGTRWCGSRRLGACRLPPACRTPCLGATSRSGRRARATGARRLHRRLPRLIGSPPPSLIRVQAAEQQRALTRCAAPLAFSETPALRTDQSTKGNTMRTFYKRALWGTLLAGGITLLGATVANAAETTGDDGLLSGTQAIIDVNLPINISGTSLSVLGDSSSTGATTAAPAPAPGSGSGRGDDERLRRHRLGNAGPRLGERADHGVGQRDLRRRRQFVDGCRDHRSRAGSRTGGCRRLPRRRARTACSRDSRGSSRSPLR